MHNLIVDHILWLGLQSLYGLLQNAFFCYSRRLDRSTFGDGRAIDRDQLA